MPPGLSLIVQENLTNLPSAAKPRSKHRPSIVVSIFPPQSGITTLKFFFKKSILQNFYNYQIDLFWNLYFFPFNSGHNPAKTAATPEAPPPSTTAFSISTHLKMAMATHSSETVTILSIKGAKKVMKM